MAVGNVEGRSPDGTKLCATFQDLSAFRLPPNFRGRGALTVQLWWFVQSTLVHLSPQVMYSWRRWVLRLFGARVGKGVRLRSSVTITYPWKVSIGESSWIGDEVVLYSLGEIDVGKNVVISQRSYICAATHDYSSYAFDIAEKKITIRDEAWLATDVFVAPGVTIGFGVVVGARSSVFNDLTEGMVYTGTPAIARRTRTTKDPMI
jgi:putative colanic acid biosynthesis acetyltransferase WcaF